MIDRTMAEALMEQNYVTEQVVKTVAEDEVIQTIILGVGLEILRRDDVWKEFMIPLIFKACGFDVLEGHAFDLNNEDLELIVDCVRSTVMASANAGLTDEVIRKIIEQGKAEFDVLV